MIQLFTIATPPRSGTKWFAELFTADRSYCYHELTTLMQPYPSNVVLLHELSRQAADHDFEQTQRRLLLQGFSQYFARLWERASFGQFVVGNSDAMAVRCAPALWLLWPDMKFLYSFRNGINQVNSSYAGKGDFPAALEGSQAARFGTTDYFEQCCRGWAKYVERLQEGQRWLAERGADLTETRLELVTTDAEELHRVWDWLVGYWDEYEARNRKLMSTPVNARVNVEKVVSWEQIWEGWSTGQQQLFAAICGRHQEQLGYQLPGVPAGSLS